MYDSSSADDEENKKETDDSPKSVFSIESDERP